MLFYTVFRIFLAQVLNNKHNNFRELDSYSGGERHITDKYIWKIRYFLIIISSMGKTQNQTIN